MKVIFKHTDDKLLTQGSKIIMEKNSEMSVLTRGIISKTIEVVHCWINMFR